MVAFDVLLISTLSILKDDSFQCKTSYFPREVSNIFHILTASLIREVFRSAVASFFFRLVHTGFSLVPHGSNDPLIILYSDALIKLMC